MDNNIFDVSSKTILVTGASSGIGKAIAKKLVQCGANVILTGRNSEKLQLVVDEIGTNVLYYLAIDVNDDVQLESLVKSMPNVDGVVFCAGIAEYIPSKILNKSKLQNTLDTNFISQTQLTRLLLKFKKLKSNSSLLYISSLAAKQGVIATAAYSASKAALSAYMRVIASELAQNGIRSNALCPGIISTDMGDSITNLNPDIASKYPLGLGTTDDVANTSIFFLSDASRWITGAELIMDGGLTLN